VSTSNQQGGGNNHDGAPDPQAQQADAERRSRKIVTGLIQLGVVIAVIAAAYVVTLFLQERREPPAAKPPEAARILVETVKPERIPAYTLQVETTGTVIARARVSIAPQVGGRVISVLDTFRDGGRFEAGEVLFQIDPQDYDVAVESAQARVADVEARLEQTEAEAANSVRDWKRVYPNEPPPPLVARTPQLKALRADLDAARAQLRDAKLDRARTEYTLPFDGRVIATSVTEGQLLAPNQPYGEAYALNALEVAVDITPAELDRLDPVLERSGIARAAGGVRGESQVVVARLGAELDPRTRTYPLRLSFRNGRTFLPGTFVDVTLDGPVERGVFRLPPTAVSITDYVWTVVDGTLKQVGVQVLDRSDTAVFVRPFDADEGVVVSPLINPKDGQDVRVAGDTIESARTEGGEESEPADE